MTDQADSSNEKYLSLDAKTASANLPPYSMEAEQSVLGGLMVDSHMWDTVSERIHAEDFYHPSHGVIFNVIEQLIGSAKAVDHLTLAEALDQQGELERVGGMAYLLDLSQNTPSISNISDYADIVYEHSILRQLINASRAITDQAYHPKGADSHILLEEAERRIFSIAEKRVESAGVLNVKEVLNSTIDRIDQLFNAGDAVTGLTTGFDDLNELTSGLQNSDLVIVAGRPSMGKTTLAMNMVESSLMQLQDKNALVFSLEMPAQHLMMRMLASLGRVDQTRIRTGKLEEEDWPKLTAAMQILQNQRLFIDDTPGISPAEMRARARRVAREHGNIGIIMVDYLQLMQIRGFGEGRTNEISEISRSLKALAKEFDCPVVALSQLNRSLEQRPNKRPINSDLRESGAIEQDADVIMFIYRDEVYNPETEHKGVGEIIIGKQRNGPIGTVRVAFRGNFCRFENLAPQAYESFSNAQ